jgi:hypothetical protein
MPKQDLDGAAAARLTARKKIKRPAIVDRRELVRWILDHFDRKEPCLPITEAGRKRVDALVWQILAEEEGFDNIPIVPSNIVQMIEVTRWNDKTALRCGQMLLAFTQSIYEGRLGEYSPEMTGGRTFDPIPFARVIDMAFYLDPELRALFQIRLKKHKRLITATAEGQRIIGASVVIELPRLQCMPDFEAFDLLVPYP